MANVTLNFSNVTNNGKPCKDPVILILGSDNVAFPCGDKVDANGNIKLTVPDSIFEGRQCISGVIKCSECDSCKEQDFTICLCDENNPCEACQECVGGVCIDKCPDQKCVNGACCDCETSSDCGNGYLCNGCNCICPTGIKDSQGNCVQCLTNQQCGPCEECVNGECVSTCADGLVCGPNGCTCPAGTEWDPITLKCKAIECSSDKDCPECQVCVNGECVPIKCPEGMKCVNGECVPWPCDKPCNNGADCGEGCGCLDGQCIPCELLDCKNVDSPLYGRCAEVPGCECRGEACVGVANCGEYCDEFNPCTTPGCTCYNNTCVSCSNFECTDTEGGCTSYDGCACDDAGNCVGDAAGPCRDTLKITKKEDCSVGTGCALVADLTLEKPCGCDAIRFNEITIGDNEIISGSIKTVVTHYDVNNNILNSVNVSPVAAATINNNVVAPIDIKQGTHFKKEYTTPSGNLGTRVVIELKAEAISIVNSGCVKYDNVTIASYELNFRNDAGAVETCAKLGGEFASIKESFTNDKVSSKRPLFIWSKGISNFGTGKFDDTTTTYNKGGWFRKAYGTQTSSGWKDEINRPQDGLWNNYNYQVRVNCGCSTTATLNNLVYCCPTDFVTELTDCGTKLNINAFNTCLVNQNLTSLGLTKFPEEVQTYYKAIINGGEHELILKQDGGNLQSNTSYIHTKPISNVTFKQFYKGNAIVAEACEKSYDFTPENKPEYDVVVSCGSVSVTPKAGNPNIVSASVKILPNGQSLNLSKVGNTQKFEISSASLATNVKIGLYLSFQGSNCQVYDEYDITCNYTAEINPFGTVVGNCTVDKTGIACGDETEFIAKALTGFTANCEFSEFGSNIWLKPDTTTAGNITKKYKTKPYSKLQVQVRELVNGKYIYALTTSVELISPIQTKVVSVPRCGDTKGKITISGTICDFGKPKDIDLPVNVTYKISSTSTTWNTEVVTNGSNPTITVEVPLPDPGHPTIKIEESYTVEIIKDETYTNPSYNIKNGKGLMCPFKETIKVTEGTVTLQPTIAFSGTGYCQGDIIPFAIRNGQGYTYSVSVTGGSLVNQDGSSVSSNLVVSSDTSFNNFVKPTLSGNLTITITNVSNAGSGCVKFSQASGNTTITPAHYLITSNAVCRNTTKVNFFLVLGGNGTAAPISPSEGPFTFNSTTNKWELLNVDALPVVDPNSPPKLQVLLNPISAACLEIVEIPYPDCDAARNCPTGNQVVNIVASPQIPTCGVGQTVTMSFVSSSLGVLDGEQYAWYEDLGTSEVLVPIIGYPNPGAIGTGNNIPNLVVASTVEQRAYKLRLSLYGGECEYDSDPLLVYSGGEVDSNFFGPGISPDTTNIVPGSSYSYTAVSYPDANYVWDLTLPDGSVVNIGTGINVAIVSTNLFQSGVNQITLTVTRNGCTSTTTLPINVPLNCSGLSAVIGTSSSATNQIQCSSIELKSLANPSGSPIINYDWQIDSGSGFVTVQSGAGLVSSLDTVIVNAGDTVDIRLYIQLANNCDFTTLPITFTRCACLCDQSNICKTSDITISGNNGGGLVYTSSVFTTNKNIEFVTSTNSWLASATENYKIVAVNGLVETVLLETGYPFETSNAGDCVRINNCPTLPPAPGSNCVDLGPSTITPGVTNIGSLVPVNAGSVPVIVNLYNNIQIQLEFTVTIPSGSFLRVYHNDSSCTSQLSWLFKMTCV